MRPACALASSDEREAVQANRDFCFLGVLPVVEPAGTLY